MKLTLRLKIIISYAALSIFLVATLLLVSNFVLDRQFQSYIKEQQELKNKDIVQLVVNEFAKGGTPSQEFYDTIGRNSLTQGIIFMVRDSSNKDIFCMSITNAAQCEDMLGTMEQTMKKLYPNFNGKYTEQSYPISIGGKDYGSVVLGYYGPFYYNNTDIHFIEMLNRIFLISAIAFLFAAIALGFFMANRISKPLKSVIAKTKQIEHGHFSDRIDFSSSTSEIAELIDSVNILANTLETQQSIKKRMAGDYAHEFRTPLTSLQSNLEGMIDGIFEVTPERLESCREEILRLTRMISDIDKIVELESDSLVLHKENFDFTKLLNQVLTTFERQIFDKHIILSVTASPLAIYADKDKISQVLVNLISNAIKYSGVDGKIDIEISEEKDSVKFSITDNGIGIAPEDLPNIFEHLYRSDLSRARDTGGSGIGLSVVKAIITAHGGIITAESELNKGSKFTFVIKK